MMLQQPLKKHPSSAFRAPSPTRGEGLLRVFGFIQRRCLWENVYIYWKFFFFLLLFFSFFTTVNATSASAELTQLLNSVHTMEADFTQVVYDNRAKPIQQSQGHMALERPGKFYWEVKKPIPQRIIANESRLWIYDPDLEQVIIRSLKQGTGDAPALLLSHTNRALDKNYVVREISKTNSPLHWFMLTPKRADNMFVSIQMGFQGEQIREMELQDHLGHRTSIQFMKTQINTSLLASLFIFKVPIGVDVIDEKN